MGKHSEWRKAAKKARRKRIRQNKARCRDQLEGEEIRKKERSPSYQRIIAKEEEERRLFAENERRIALERELEYQSVEAEAQRQFRELQKKLALAKEERAKRNEKIREEWQKEQQQQKVIREQEEFERQKEIQKQALLDAKVEDFLISGGATPEHLLGTLETNPNRAVCLFFEKTGVCRFFDACSRNHIRPRISRIILIPNFFSHISIENSENEHGSDSTLEFEKAETYFAYREFFYDVIKELEKFGPIKVFKTCNNHEAHLRGNVYVEFSETRSALKCFRQTNGRWYGGKQISVQFSSIPSWKRAICGLDYSSKCPKGSCCNFLHVFRNPRNLYNECYNNNEQKDIQTRNWRWSESPERLPLYEDRSDNHKDRYRNKYRKYSKSHHSSRTHESPDVKKHRCSPDLQYTRWSESPISLTTEADYSDECESFNKCISRKGDKMYDSHKSSSRRKHSCDTGRSSLCRKSTSSRSHTHNNSKRGNSRGS